MVTATPATVYTFETYTCIDCGETTSDLTDKAPGTVRCLECDYSATVARFPEFFAETADLERRAGEADWLERATTYGNPEHLMAVA